MRRSFAAGIRGILTREIALRASAVLNERLARRLVIALLMISGAALVAQCL